MQEKVKKEKYVKEKVTFVWLDVLEKQFIRGGMICIHRTSRPKYSGIPRNIDHGRHGPFLLQSQNLKYHFGSIYPFKSLESLMASLEVVCIMFCAVNKEFTSLKTRCRWVTLAHSLVRLNSRISFYSINIYDHYIVM